MDDGPKQQRVGRLAMEPLRLVEGQPSDLWSDPPQNILTHGEKDDCRIYRQRQTCAPRHPYGKCKGIQAIQPVICSLLPPVARVNVFSDCPTLAWLTIQTQKAQHEGREINH